MKRIAYFIISLFFLTGCIEDYDLKLPDAESRLVVEGLITNQPGPYYIHLTKSKIGYFTSPDEEYTDNSEPIMDAMVIITDDSNQVDTLKLVDFDIKEYKYDYRFGYFKLLLNEYGELVDTLFLKDPSGFNHRGFYKASRLKGISGHTYFMKIIHNDKIYESSAYMPPVPEIDSIGYLKKIMEKDGQEFFIPLMYFKEPQMIDNYYLIQLSDDISLRSGYGSSNWPFSIFSDDFLEPYVSGLNISLGTNPRGIEYPFYMEGDSIYVALSSLTKEGFNYYKALLEQFGNDGGAYKPTPASPLGNISNGGLGSFRASSVSEGRTCIKRTSNVNLLPMN